MKSISVIIPCYNCENSIFADVKRILKKLKKINIVFEIILINDGSEDSTLDQLKLSVLLSKKIKIINFTKNMGKSFVVRKAINKSKYDHIVMIDNNLPYFEVFNTIIKKLKQNYDLVFVNRRNKKSLLKKNHFRFTKLLDSLLVI